jgi:hypothetical protein
VAALESILLFVVCAVPAIALLAWRDGRRQRIADEARPTAERVSDVRKAAQHWCGVFEAMLKKLSAQRQEDWIPKMISYYQRLDALASDPNASADDANRLVDEAACYVRERRLKGMHIVSDARKLAKLLSAQKRAA